MAINIIKFSSLIKNMLMEEFGEKSSNGLFVQGGCTINYNEALLNQIVDEVICFLLEKESTNIERELSMYEQYDTEYIVPSLDQIRNSYQRLLRLFNNDAPGEVLFAECKLLCKYYYCYVADLSNMG